MSKGLGLLQSESVCNNHISLADSHLKNEEQRQKQEDPLQQGDGFDQHPKDAKQRHKNLKNLDQHYNTPQHLRYPHDTHHEHALRNRRPPGCGQIGQRGVDGQIQVPTDLQVSTMERLLRIVQQKAKRGVHLCVTVVLENGTCIQTDSISIRTVFQAPISKTCNIQQITARC